MLKNFFSFRGCDLQLKRNICASLQQRRLAPPAPPPPHTHTEDENTKIENISKQTIKWNSIGKMPRTVAAVF